MDSERRAQATNGVPIGAGNFGRVLSARTDGGAIGDLDRDGVPGSLDIDDDGDLVLDSLDRSQAARAAQAQVGDNTLFVSQLTMDLPQTANANAPGSTDQQIEAAFTNSGQGALLMIGIPPAASAELDCAGDPTADPQARFVYCSGAAPGTLRARHTEPRASAFPRVL